MVLGFDSLKARYEEQDLLINFMHRFHITKRVIFFCGQVSLDLDLKLCIGSG